MPVPTVEPHLHPAARALGSEDFRPGQPVWVHRAGAWRPGVVLHRSTQAVTVRYRPADGPGTGVDTVTSRSLADRSDADPFLDTPEWS
jgi:hypothetical protein